MPYLKFKWLQRDSNPQPFSLKANTRPIRQTDQMIDLCCEHLSVQCIWLYVFIVSHMRFVKELYLKQARYLIFKWLQRDSRKKLKRTKGFSMREKFLRNVRERSVGQKFLNGKKTFFLHKKDTFRVTFLMNRLDFLEVSSNEQMSSFSSKGISFQTYVT